MSKKDDKKEDEYTEFPCDICGSKDAIEVPYCREYTGGQVHHICKKCGLVYVKKRRSWKRIADAWSDELYSKKAGVLTPSSYTALNPHTKARLTYVAEFTDNNLGLKGKKLCDIGAGEGEFMRITSLLGAEVFGVEPSKVNCALIDKLGFKNFVGAAEDYDTHRKKTKDPYKADIVTILWTLEASQNPREMLRISHDILKDGGYVVIGTGSRILVPFKKPLHRFLSTTPSDTHPVDFSFNTLRGILAETGFELEYRNPYVENDLMVVAARKVERGKKIPWEGDDYLQVADFFERWHKESLRYRWWGQEQVNNASVKK